MRNKNQLVPLDLPSDSLFPVENLMDNIAVTTNSENEESPQSDQQLLPVQSAHSITSHRNNSQHMQLAQYEANLVLSRSPSAITQSANRDERRPSRGLFYEFIQGKLLNTHRTSRDEIIDEDGFIHLQIDREHEHRIKNRQLSDNAITTVLSAFYAKVIVVLGIAFPVTDILAVKAPNAFYQGFYFFLYLGSIGFVVFMYVDHLRTRRFYSANASEKEKKISREAKQRLGSFYLRVGAVAFGIGSMVYSGLEFGQYFELKVDSGCQNLFIALTPATRMVLSIVQMQFIFLNTKEFEMKRHQVIVRFGLMHMLATNVCEWLYVLVEETKHEIINLTYKQTSMPDVTLADYMHETNQSHGTSAHLIHGITKRAIATEIVVDCRRTNIMGSLVQNASPFLFPCTIEYSLICAVILFEMWKQTVSVPQNKRRDRKISTATQNAHHFSVDCSRAHHGMFAGILVIVLSIISLIMFYVLSKVPMYHRLATLEVTITEIILYILTAMAVFGAFIRMRDLKFNQHFDGMPLDCTLLLLAQSGVYIYCMFSIIGCYFSIWYETNAGGLQGLIAEVFSLLQTSMQTLFILNAWWRRCRSAQENRKKPGREIVTFLLVANMAMWFINALAKNRAMFRPSHLQFFGEWSWTIITHVSMPLAIFYRFHSTICLFEIWKTTYKARRDVHSH